MQQIYIGNTLVNDVYLGNKRLYDVLQNYNILAPYDPDAQAFIDVTGISGINAEAINTLVVDLKAAGFWTGLKAIYPMVGGTATTCKYNLKNPVDSDAAFRLSFGGGWTFSNSGGAIPDGAGGTYADTFFSTSANITPTNGHVSYYSLTQSSLGAGMVEIGNDDGGNEINIAASFGDTFYTFYAGAGGGGTNNSSSQGFYINNRAANTEGWRNGTRIINTGNGTVSVPTRVLYLAAQNNGSTSNRNSNRACGYSSIGDTLSDPATYSSIINTYNTTLGRNTY
jgi:hypothetical protein